MNVPSYMRRVGASWSPATPPGQAIGYSIQYKLRLRNVSESVQTGTLSYLAGTDALANEPNPAGGVRSPTFYVKYLLCGSVGTGSPMLAGPGAPEKTPAAHWTLPARQSIDLSVAAVFYSTYSNNLAGPGHDGCDSYFQPDVLISIDQDRGAVIANVTSLVEGSSGKMCDGSSVNFSAPIAYPFFGLDMPILINGGRPF